MPSVGARASPISRGGPEQGHFSLGLGSGRIGWCSGKTGVLGSCSETERTVQGANLGHSAGRERSHWLVRAVSPEAGGGTGRCDRLSQVSSMCGTGTSHSLRASGSRRCCLHLIRTVPCVFLATYLWSLVSSLSLLSPGPCSALEPMPCSSMPSPAPCTCLLVCSHPRPALAQYSAPTYSASPQGCHHPGESLSVSLLIEHQGTVSLSWPSEFRLTPQRLVSWPIHSSKRDKEVVVRS